jgi:hypothetical protein
MLDPRTRPDSSVARRKESDRLAGPAGPDSPGSRQPAQAPGGQRCSSWRGSCSPRLRPLTTTTRSRCSMSRTLRPAVALLGCPPRLHARGLEDVPMVPGFTAGRASRPARTAVSGPGRYPGRGRPGRLVADVIGVARAREFLLARWPFSDLKSEIFLGRAAGADHRAIFFVRRGHFFLRVAQSLIVSMAVGTCVATSRHFASRPITDGVRGSPCPNAVARMPVMRLWHCHVLKGDCVWH